MSPAEYERLREDIRANGLLQAIVTHEEKILDGRHRYRACIELGVPARFEPFSGGDPVAFVYSHNIARRQLSKGQLAMAAAKLKGYFAEQARARMAAGGGDKRSGRKNSAHPVEDTGKARDKAAAQFGVSGAAVDQAERVLKKAIPEVRRAVETGEISVNQGAKMAELPKDRQRMIVELPDKRSKSAAIQRSINLSRGATEKPESYIGGAALEPPGTELVRSFLSRLEVITNDIERRGMTPEQYVEAFLREMQRSEPLLVTRLAYVSATIRALSTLALAAEKARREAA